MKNSIPIVLSMVILIAAASGCKMLKTAIESRSAANSNAAPPAVAPKINDSSSTKSPASASGDPLQDLKTTSKRFSEENAFHAVMDMHGKTDSHMEVSYVAPDRYSIKNGVMETVIIGKQTYMKLNGSWKKFPVDMASQIPNLRQAFTEEAMKGISNARYLDDDTVDGKDAFVLEYDGDYKGVGAYTSSVWIGKDDGLPMKIEVRYSDGALQTMTTDYDYDNVTIDPPVEN